MTNERPLEMAELKIADIIHSCSDSAHLFREVSPMTAKIIRKSYFAVCDLRSKTDATDEGDRELLHSYADMLIEIANALKEL